MLDDRVEERAQILARRGGFRARGAVTRVRVEDRELDLVLGRIEIDEQVVDLVQDLLRARVRPVDLVHDDDRRQPAFERLAQHEPRLRQRPLRRVDEQDDPVDHRQRALDFAAEVGVARRIADVDQQVVVMHGRVLGEDRDAALALEIVAVHHAVCDLLVGAERAALPQQGSTSVVLPWSTCAMMATLRRSGFAICCDFRCGDISSV